MPITITVPGPTPFVGPGVLAVGSSDFIGPFPTGSIWRLSVDTIETQEANIFLEEFPVSLPSSEPLRLLSGVATLTTIGGAQVVEGTSVTVRAEIQEPGGAILDTGATTLPWHIANLGQQQVLLPSSSVQGGFTSSDRAQ